MMNTKTKKTKVGDNTTQFANQAWVRNGSGIVTGEALILACLLHTKGKGRQTDDMKTVQTLMNDVNLEKE